jgi:hypothetical protein
MSRTSNPGPRLPTSLGQRIERAAHDLNPYLVVLAIG